MLKKTWAIQCNTCGEVALLDGEEEADAAYEARRLKWDVRLRVDLCPECSKEAGDE